MSSGNPTTHPPSRHLNDPHTSAVERQIAYFPIARAGARPVAPARRAQFSALAVT